MTSWRTQTTLAAAAVEGDWINASRIRLGLLKNDMHQEGYLRMKGESFWLSPFSLQNLAGKSLAAPLESETHVTTLNFTSTIQRAIAQHYPHLQDLAPGPDGSRPPIARPSFTILVRPDDAAGKL